MFAESKQRFSLTDRSSCRADSICLKFRMLPFLKFRMLPFILSHRKPYGIQLLNGSRRNSLLGKADVFPLEDKLLQLSQHLLICSYAFCRLLPG